MQPVPSFSRQPSHLAPHSPTACRKLGHLTDHVERSGPLGFCCSWRRAAQYFLLRYSGWYASVDGGEGDRAES